MKEIILKCATCSKNIGTIENKQHELKVAYPYCGGLTKIVITSDKKIKTSIYIKGDYRSH